MARKTYEIRNSGTIADITILGDINWWQNSADEFTRQLTQLRAAGVTELRGYINSGGGSLFDALEIYNQLEAFPGRKTVKLGALVASAATVIACAFKDGIEMAKNGQYMIHDPYLEACGGEKELEAGIQLWRNIRKSAVDLYVKRTGLAETEVSDMMTRTTWLTAEQAKVKGFITAISGEVDELPDDTAAVLNKYGFKNVPTVLNQVIQPPQNPTIFLLPQMTKGELIVKMGLPSDATDAQVYAALAKVQDEKVAAEAALREERDRGRKQLAETLVDNAISAKKIGAGERDQWVSDAVANPEMVKRMLDKLPAAESATSQITETPTNSADTADRSKWGWDDYVKNDGKALVAMREKQPNQYKTLFQARYPGQACEI